MSVWAEGTYAVYDERSVVARKPHECCACDDVIPWGHRYTRIGIVFDGRAWTLRRCLRCQMPSPTPEQRAEWRRLCEATRRPHVMGSAAHCAAHCFQHEVAAEIAVPALLDLADAQEKRIAELEEAHVAAGGDQREGPHQMVHTQYLAELQESRSKARAKLAAVRDVLASELCDCPNEIRDDIDNEPVEPCLACRIEAAIGKDSNDE